ncbi:MAG: hypothetical protein SGI92_18825 [Bryobacteraceae bacterium]|nr:hypothetical protein [Bryobacteraceae bacterium]
MHAKTFILAATLSVAPGLLHAQFDFKLAGRNVQVHSFGSQGFIYSNDNNYLTMKTTSGSFAFSDMGANVSTQLTDKLRIGAQLYTRNVGKIGNWSPELDWASLDYRFRDWLGFRGGKVKTVVGLFNDTQDLEFLHTWALLPTSVYSIDARGDTIAHLGIDLYGSLSLKRLGGLAYTVYGGKRPSDMEGGFVYGLSTSSLVTTPQGPVYVAAIGKKIESYGGPVFGADLRWNTPLKGLLLGASYMQLDTTTKGYYLSNRSPYVNRTLVNRLNAFYIQYTVGNLALNGEYRKENRDTLYNSANGSMAAPSIRNSRQGYVSASYRLAKWLEVGTYHSRFVLNWHLNHGDPRNHIFDQAVTARFDLKSYLHLKVEGHFTDGAMINSGLNRGFYAAPNPNGLAPQMKMLVMRLGFHL